MSAAAAAAEPGRAPLAAWLGLGAAALSLLPWHGDDAGVFAFAWLGGWPAGASAPALALAALHGQAWLWPLAVPLVIALPTLRRPEPDLRDGARLVLAGALGLAWLLLIALSIDLRGWTWSLPAELFGPRPRRNPGFGPGPYAFGLACVMVACRGLAARGWCKGDFFVVGALGLVTAALALFVFYPLGRMALAAVQTPRGAFAPELFWPRLANDRIWRWGGVVPNTLLLGIASATSSTMLALAFALVAVRTNFRARRLLGMLSVLPIITPPFVVGLSVILLFGRNGAVNHALEWAFGFEGGRWVYGFPGVWFAQTLSFTPIAYLVLVGVVQGINPALEEAAQTLRAEPPRVLGTVTLPLALPGIANAALIGFVESLADFGNPLLLGGDFEVLATSIYFAIVGARQDRGIAAVLGLILLAFMLAAFFAQRRVLAGKDFTTISGKGQAGRAMTLPPAARLAAYALALPWAALTLVIYGTILFGAFVETWGLNHTLTLKHWIAAFGVDTAAPAWRFTGAAWGSLGTTLLLAAIAAPLTAVIGLLTAWLIERQRFRGRGTFEIGTMLAGAVPGTVLGIAYILAFNNPPLELVQGGLIVVASFVVRNMAPGVRAGMATLAQIDRSLEEASSTLRAGATTTIRRVLLPLLRPAIVAALVYGFVSAMTTVSAVIFLVSPGTMLSTVYIVNLAEAGTYGVAIAYASALIVLMLAVVLGIGAAVGERRIGRRDLAALAAGSAA